MTPTQRKLRAEQLRHAMSNLATNSHFADFISLLREMKETSVEDACRDATVASQRASMAAIGEIRAYKQILDTYDDFLSTALPQETE